MAKLRIDDVNGNLIPDEYINVVNGLFLKDAVTGRYPNYEAFLDADPDERPAILQSFVVGSRKIQHQPENGPPQVISANNCLIFTERDRKKKGNRRSRVTVPMPDAPPVPLVPGDPVFKYLLGYAKLIHDMYAEIDDENDHADIDRCTKFMFGVMLLTRCR
jgi:hypothetical protein